MWNVKWLSALLCIVNIRCSMIVVPETKSPHDLSNSIWHEVSTPVSDSSEEVIDTTTYVHEPFFEENSTQINMTTQLGSDVYLHCRVNDLREKMVSWVRRKGDQLHLITFGASIYISDSRYSLEFKQPNDWQLHIQYANERDEGQFECQINTSPPLILIVCLEVIVPRVDIVDERGLKTSDKFYKSGSTIELKCVISKIPQPTSYVTWKHGLRMLNYDTSRGGISVKTNLNSGGAVSRLYIANANRYDSGNYTCSLGDSAKTTIAVHVLNGENPAAAQQSGTITSWSRFAFYLVFISITISVLHQR
ncbi:CLUMA_CG011420, isoform A [Clunio marinus]|uniref:CLUMA_CG011420, isoform A n=1 Tax=Clunio marinus TaxID=568069 RepID=A0A1J1ICX0_9DIPT|nr:CLUMA_CG011420, isoform A [Clunio marinus]